MLLSTTDIDSLLRSSHVTGPNYRGTFPCDMLPRLALFPHHKPALIVVNKGPSSSEGSHWILVYFPRDSRLPSYLFDSLGLDLSHTRDDQRIRAFILRNNKRGYVANFRRIQAPESTSCGLYVLAAAWLLSRHVPPDSLHHHMAVTDDRLRLLIRRMYSPQN